jgi:hypothetical protein
MAAVCCQTHGCSVLPDGLGDNGITLDDHCRQERLSTSAAHPDHTHPLSLVSTFSLSLVFKTNPRTHIREHQPNRRHCAEQQNVVGSGADQASNSNQNQPNNHAADTEGWSNCNAERFRRSKRGSHGALYCTWNLRTFSYNDCVKLVCYMDMRPFGMQ